MTEPGSPVVSMDAITKTFPGVKALDQVRLDLYPGQVTALVGENGAGKSTTVKILTGIYRPDGGTIRIDGNPVALATPNDAAPSGITAIHQETVLFDELSVAENVFIRHAPRTRLGLIDRAEMHRAAPPVAGTDRGTPSAAIPPLPNLGSPKKILVPSPAPCLGMPPSSFMHEPTPSLSIRNSRNFPNWFKPLKAKGKAFLFITPKSTNFFPIYNENLFPERGLRGQRPESPNST